MEHLTQINIEHARPHLQERMSPFGRPLHLQFLDEAFANDLIDRRFYKCRADGVALPVAFTEVRGSRIPKRLGLVLDSLA